MPAAFRLSGLVLAPLTVPMIIGANKQDPEWRRAWLEHIVRQIDSLLLPPAT